QRCLRLGERFELRRVLRIDDLGSRRQRRERQRAECQRAERKRAERKREAANKSGATKFWRCSHDDLKQASAVPSGAKVLRRGGRRQVLAASGRCNGRIACCSPSFLRRETRLRMRSRCFGGWHSSCYC